MSDGSGGKYRWRQRGGMLFFFFSSRRRHTRLQGDWSSDVCSSDLSTWESSSAAHGSRFISERLDPNHWRRTQFISEDAGKTWKLLFTDDLERDTKK